MSETPEQQVAPQAETVADPTETRNAIEKARKEYPKGLQIAFECGKDVLRGNAIFQASYAAEKISEESTRRIVASLVKEFELQPLDIPHAVEADKRHGFDAAKAAIELGFRRTDIPYAALSFGLWPNLKEGIEAMGEMVKMFKRVRADVHEADIRYAALTLRNLDIETLERALRDRHNKNEREPWLRAASIPIVAYCYKLSAPHTGPAIDACRDKGTRRERIGHEVLAALGRRFKKELAPPTWLG